MPLRIHAVMRLSPPGPRIHRKILDRGGANQRHGKTPREKCDEGSYLGKKFVRAKASAFAWRYGGSPLPPHRRGHNILCRPVSEQVQSLCYQPLATSDKSPYVNSGACHAFTFNRGGRR